MFRRCCVWFLLMPLVFLGPAVARAGADPVARMGKEIRKMDIVAYELRWLVRGEELGFAVIHQGERPETIAQLRGSLADVRSRQGNAWTAMSLLPYGILTLSGRDGGRVEIGVSEEGFAAYNSSDLAAYFTSPGLAGVVRTMTQGYAGPGELVMREDLFTVLASSPPFDQQ